MRVPAAPFPRGGFVVPGGSCDPAHSGNALDQESEVSLIDPEEPVAPDAVRGEAAVGDVAADGLFADAEEVRGVEQTDELTAGAVGCDAAMGRLLRLGTKNAERHDEGIGPSCAARRRRFSPGGRRGPCRATAASPPPAVGSYDRCRVASPWTRMLSVQLLWDMTLHSPPWDPSDRHAQDVGRGGSRLQ